jgi:phosphatidate cytidylyltransferase
VAGSRKDRGESEEDLFEDLDEFFAPLDETDWPDEEELESEPPAEGAAPPPEGPGAEPGVPAEGEPALEDLEGLEIDIPPEEDLVGAEAPPAETPPTPPAEPPAPGLPADETEPVEAAAVPGGGEDWEKEADQDWLAESTSELEGEEWDRLRGPAPEEPARPDEAEPAAAGGGPSVEELSAAPPEYAELPGPPDEEEPVLAEEATLEAEEEVVEPAGLEDLEDLPAMEEAGAAAPADQAAPPSAPPLEEEEVVAVGEPGEPEAVEAAAEHFAEGVRESPEDVERELLADLEEPAAASTVRIDPAAPAVDTGPSWEEGAAHPVVTEEPEEAEEAEAPVGGRNLTAALISGVVLAAAVLILLAIGSGPFAFFAGLIILFGQAEFYAVMRTKGLQPATLLGLVCGGLMVAGAYLKGDAAVLLGLFLAMGLTVLWYMAAPATSRKQVLQNAGATLLGVLYVPFLASFAMLLLAAPFFGRNVFLTVVGLTILYDVCAYAIGTLWGNRPLAPTISPKKSWEGAIGATFILLLVALAIVPSIDPFNPFRSVGLALVIAVAAPLGDLVESALKRDLGVKDMGTILPGHGGVLDRIDAILFTAPAAYYFLRLAFF